MKWQKVWLEKKGENLRQKDSFKVYTSLIETGMTKMEIMEHMGLFQAFMLSKLNGPFRQLGMEDSNSTHVES